MLRVKSKVYGKSLAGQETVHEDARACVKQQNGSLIVPKFLAGRPATLDAKPSPVQPTSSITSRPGSKSFVRADRVLTSDTPLGVNP
jgi:hypothetical protein